MKYDITSIEQLQEACKQLKAKYQPPVIFTLTGNLGSGKTTFVTHFLKQFDDSVLVNSPTYSLVNEYEVDGTVFYHFDLYRLKDELELLNIGFEDYIDGGDYIFIEWPELAMEFLHENVVMLKFKNSKFDRSLTVEDHE